MKEMILKLDDHVIWTIGKTPYKCVILPQDCPKCSLKGNLIGLPAPLLKKQPDKTNVVCHPYFGGCNNGFEMEVPEGVLSHEWELK